MNGVLIKGFSGRKEMRLLIGSMKFDEPLSFVLFFFRKFCARIIVYNAVLDLYHGSWFSTGIYFMYLMALMACIKKTQKVMITR